MERKFYRNNEWYKLTDDEYWAEDYPDEFPNCQTVVYSEKYGGLYIKETCPYGWGTMSKINEFKFMIIEKP